MCLWSIVTSRASSSFKAPLSRAWLDSRLNVSVSGHIPCSTGGPTPLYRFNRNPYQWSVKDVGLFQGLSRVENTTSIRLFTRGQARKVLFCPRHCSSLIAKHLSTGPTYAASKSRFGLSSKKQTTNLGVLENQNLGLSLVERRLRNGS